VEEHAQPGADDLQGRARAWSPLTRFHRLIGRSCWGSRRSP